MTSSESERWCDLCHAAYNKLLQGSGWASLAPEEREAAALWRFENDVNNGGFIQWYGNWDQDSVDYALRGLRHLGAKDTLRICVDALNLLVSSGAIIGTGYQAIDSMLNEMQKRLISEYNEEYFAYPDDLAVLGLRALG